MPTPHFRILSSALLVSSLAIGLMPATVFGVSTGASVSVLPRATYLDDQAGTPFTFRVRNYGDSTIGSARIERPGSFWNIVACPAGPNGWTRVATAEHCDYLSAPGVADDIPLTKLRTFRVRATSGQAAGNQTGVWNVIVSPTENPVGSGYEQPATPLRPGHLDIKAFSFQVTDVVLASSPPVVGEPCPAPDKSAEAAGTGNLAVVCGLNRTTGTLQTRGSFSKLTGSMIAGHGSFTRGFVAPSSATGVVLGYWNDVTITAAEGSDKFVSARTGAAATNSPWTSLAGYEATEPPAPPDENDAPVLADSTLTLNSVNEDAAVPSGAVGTAVSSLVGLGSNVTDPDGPGLGIAVIGGVATGTLWYSTNGGTNWTSFGAPSSANGSNALTLSATNGRLFYQPASNANGTITNVIQLRAWDESSGTNGATTGIAAVGGPSAFSSGTDAADITVTAVNDAPTAANAAFSMTENTTKTFSAATGVLDDADDVDLDALVAVLVDGPDHAASFTLNSDGSFSYQPVANYTGADSFSWKARDPGNAESSTATVSITVNDDGGGGGGGGGGCLISC